MAVVLPFTFVNGTVADANQVNANFNAVAGAVARTVLMQNTTFYVAPAPVGIDAPGNGLNAASPAATMTYILNLLRSSYDLNMQGVTIQLANGNYTESVNNIGAMVGLQSAGQLMVQGNMANPSLVTWSADVCFDCSNGALATVQGVTMSSAVSQCIISQEHARILINNINFGATPNGSHMLAARGGLIEARGNYSITGGALVHANVLEAGEIFIDPGPGNYVTYGSSIGVPTVTIPTAVNFGGYFAQAANCGIMRIGAAFTGAGFAGCTGVRYNARFNGVINVVGQGANYLPGNAAGTPVPNTSGTTGGQYN